MNERGGSCFPSIDTQERETGRGRQTIIAAHRELKTARFIAIEQGGGRGRPNRYQATFPNRSESDPFKRETVPGSREKGSPSEREDVKPLGRDLPSEGAAAHPSRPRSPEWKALRDAVVAVCGWDPKEMTRTAWGRVAKAVTELLNLEEPATPEEVESFAIFWHRRYGSDVDLTPQTITGNWAAWRAGKLFETRSRR
jgi:hypothetical protein